MDVPVVASVDEVGDDDWRIEADPGGTENAVITGRRENLGCTLLEVYLWGSEKGMESGFLVGYEKQSGN